VIDEIKDIARDAGAAIMDIYQSNDFDVQKKADDSPLTKADLAAHNIICEGLRCLLYTSPSPRDRG